LYHRATFNGLVRSVTQITEKGAPDDAQRPASKVISNEQIAELILAIAMMNLFISDYLKFVLHSQRYHQAFKQNCFKAFLLFSKVGGLTPAQ